MATIIAARFQEQARAEDAAADLEAAGFPRDQIASFFVNPPGQHAVHGTEADPGASPGAHEGGEGAVKGAATGGTVGAVASVAAIPLVGPAAPAIGAAIGAYIGSLQGALGNLEHPDKSAKDAGGDRPEPGEPLTRESGMLVAVSAGSPEQQDRAIALLRAHGGMEVERAQGTIAQGDWEDFDPQAPPVLADR